VKGQVIDPGTPVPLFPIKTFFTGVGRSYDVASDGRILINRVVDEGPASPITVVLNWKAGGR
jgi:hypothetical protein